MKVAPITAAEIWKEYEEGLQYQKEMGFAEKWPEYERFKAGDQWPAATDRTKNLPRPVLNMIAYIEDHKVSSVMNENIKMIYSPMDATFDEMIQQKLEDACDKYTRFADATWEEIKQEMLNEEMLDTASNIGTGLLHYYWNRDPEGGLEGQRWIGMMAGEEIDPINFFVRNPQILDVQKQPSIIISKRELVLDVIEQGRANGIPEQELALIQPDKETKNEGYDAAQHEIKGTDKCIVLIRYFRQGGKVVFTKSTQAVVFQPETPLGQGNHKLYPIAKMTWKKRRKSFFGIGDTEGLIPNQKLVNFNYAMFGLAIQLTSWPKLVYKKGSLPTGYQPTNAPGEVIEDQGITQGQNIWYLNPGTIPGSVLTLADNILQFTRELAGAHEAATGEAPSSQLNASAIMMLQKAAAIPIESIRRRFYRCQEDVARIWEEFYKDDYNTLRTVFVRDDDEEKQPMEFRGSDFADIGMMVKIDIGPASAYTEQMMVTQLDRFLEKQYITFEEYLKYAPKNVVPFKDRLMRDKQAQAEMAAQAQANQAAQIQQVLANLPPELRARIEQLPPDQQQQMIQEVIAESQGQTAAPAQGGGGPPMMPAMGQ